MVPEGILSTSTVSTAIRGPIICGGRHGFPCIHTPSPAPGAAPLLRGHGAPCFASLGIGQGELADYVTDLLARFSRTDQLYRVRDSGGRPLHTLTGLLLELMEEWGSDRAWSFDREVDLRRHAGDYALFLSGIFRPHVEAGGHLPYYLREGGESYRLVGEHLQLAGARQARLFRGMADRFEELSGTPRLPAQGAHGPGPPRASLRPGPARLRGRRRQPVLTPLAATASGPPAGMTASPGRARISGDRPPPR